MTTRSLLFAGVALVLLTGCGDDKTPEAATEEKRIYGSLDACLDDAASMDEVKLCRESYAQAQEKMAAAPSYPAQASCEEAFGAGNCVPRAVAATPGGGNGGVSWLPALAGFMIGRELAGGTPRYSSEPIYRDRAGQMYAPAYGRLDIPPQPAEEQRAQSSGGGGGGWSSSSWTSSSSGGDSKSGSSKSVWKSSPSRPSGGSIWTSSPSRSSSGKVFTSSSSVSRGGFGSTASAHASAGG